MNNGNIAIITLSPDYNSFNKPTNFYKLEKLSDDKIEEILAKENEQLDKRVIERLVRFATGFPRFAVLLSENYQSNPTESEEYIKISDEGLLNKLIAGHYEGNTDTFNKIKKVLTGLSLFSKVGWKDKLEEELKWLAGYLELDLNEVKQIIREQINRGLIIANNYLSVTPFVLRVYLIDEWWKFNDFSKPENFDNNFIQKIPDKIREDLLLRFGENLKYIGNNPKGSEFVKMLLSEKGFLANLEDLDTQIGGNFFLNLAEAFPEESLKYLKSKIDLLNINYIKNWIKGRREVVWALEKIVVWKETAIDAMRLLLKLAEGENEGCANNATGIFTQLFFTVYPLTEISFEERMSVLREAMVSESEEKILVVLDACNKIYETSMSIGLGAEHQGIRKEPVINYPTREQIKNYYIEVWSLINEKFNNYNGKIKQKSLEIILNNSRHLLQIPFMKEMVLKTLIEISKINDYRQIILEKIIQILHYESKKLDQDIKEVLGEIKGDLTGSDFPSLLRRYVGMDLVEDRFDENGEYGDYTSDKIKELAKQAVENVKLLEKEFDWLFSEQARKVNFFGYSIAKLDKNFTLLDKLINLRKKYKDTTLFGGYLSFIFESDKDLWEKVINSFYEDSAIQKLLPQLIWRSGISDNSLQKIISLAKENIINEDDLWIFTYGRAIEKVSEKLFEDYVRVLLGYKRRKATALAINCFDAFYLRDDEKKDSINLPKDLTLDLLLSEGLFIDDQREVRYQLESYHWKRIADNFIKKYPKESIKIAQKIIQNSDKNNGFLDDIHNGVDEVLNKIACIHPKKIWEEIAKLLEPPHGRGSFFLSEWLKGGSFFREGEYGALEIFNLEDIFNWIDEDIEHRAWYVAHFVPKALFRDENKKCLVREIIIRYGDRDDVRRNLMANFSTEGWSGPASLHYTQKKEALEKFKKEEDNSNVLIWLTDYIEILNKNIKEAEIEEERTGY